MTEVEVTEVSESSEDTPMLEMRDVTKTFGSVISLFEISTMVRAGQVTCVLGDNGAGKSTLIKMLSGVHQPDHGQLLVDGVPVRFNTPRDALDAGIATVFQDLAMVPLMAIWRNFFLGSEPTKGWGPFRRFDAASAKRITRQEMGEMGIDIRDPDQPVGTLSGGERQSVAIARAVHFGARLLILDEPTRCGRGERRPRTAQGNGDPGLTADGSGSICCRIRCRSTPIRWSVSGRCARRPGGAGST